METLQKFGFCSSLGGKGLDSGNMYVLSLTEFIHVPGISLERDTLELVFYRRDPRGAPLVGVGTVAVFEQEEGAVVDSRSLADFFKSFSDPFVQILGCQVAKLRGDGRYQVFKMNLGV